MKTVTNRDVVISVYLQRMIDYIFGRGSLYHFEWEEIKPAVKTKDDIIANLRVKLKVCFSPTYSIDLRAEFDLIKQRSDPNDTEWFYVFHEELNTKTGFLHTLRGSKILFYGGNGTNGSDKFLDKLGFIKG